MFGEKMHQILSDYQYECKIIAISGCLLAASVCGLKWKKKKHFLNKVEQERKRRDQSVKRMKEAVEKFIKQNPEVDRSQILNLPLPELCENIKDGSISPEAVLYSYAEKALEVNKETNCVTVFLTDCETQLREHKKQQNKGPLYGIPVSIKEHIGYKGHPSTAGLIQYLDELETEDSVIVKVLKSQGAVVFAKTNIPQCLLSYETSNPIYGLTRNPRNLSKGASGSSGGEGALIGGGGSVLGFGTDLGGSIRLPASFCGIAGFKPTPNRLSIHGVRPCIEGLLSVQLCIGPMARDVDSLVLCMKALLCDEMFKLDPTVPPIPFNDEVYSASKPLRVGYYETDGFTMPHPGMRRAVLETKKLLEKAGHTLVPFTPPRVDYAKLELYLKALLDDGGKTFKEKFKPNIGDPNLDPLNSATSTTSVLKTIQSFLLRPLYPRISRFLISSRGASTVKDHWKNITEIQEYQTEFIGEWRKLNLDVLLCPMLGPAYNIGYAGKLLAAISYTMLFNILQFPAGSLTVSSVTEEDEEELKSYEGYYKDPWDKLFKEAVEDAVGLPLSVQCVALPHQDELCLRLMKEVETVHRQNKNKQ